MIGDKETNKEKGKEINNKENNEETNEENNNKEMGGQRLSPEESTQSQLMFFIYDNRNARIREHTSRRLGQSPSPVATQSPSAASLVRPVSTVILIDSTELRRCPDFFTGAWRRVKKIAFSLHVGGICKTALHVLVRICQLRLPLLSVFQPISTFPILNRGRFTRKFKELF